MDVEDLEIYQELAQRLGFGPKLAGTAAEWCQRLLAPVASEVTLPALKLGALRNPLAARVLFAERRFETEDGKFHFLRSLPADEEPADADYPLMLGSFSTPEAQSSQWSRPIQGRPLMARCHPEAAPWATEGIQARLCSRQGHLEVELQLDPRLHPRLVLIPKGGWVMHGQAANALVRAETTDIGLGAAYYDEAVRLEPLGGPAAASKDFVPQST